jgi:hypothetical protein
MSANETHAVDAHAVEARNAELHDVEGWRYASKAMTWYGRGSPVGVGLFMGLFIISIGAFLALIHVAGVL